jgi:hypothetical protein
MIGPVLTCVQVAGYPRKKCLSLGQISQAGFV